MIDKSHMTIDLLEKNTQLKPTMVFDPDNIVDPNLVELSVEPSEIKLVENGEGTTALSLSFKFNGYDDVLSAEVPVTVDLPEENKVLDFTLELSESDLNNFESLDLAFQMYQRSPNSIKLLEPYSNDSLPTYSRNYKSIGDINSIENIINIELDKPKTISTNKYLYSVYNTESSDEVLSNINFINCKNYLYEINFNNLGNNIANLPVDIFKECSKLNNIKLPTYLQEITGDKFNGCSSLVNINIDTTSISSVLSSNNGILYSSLNELLVKYPQLNETEMSATFLSTIKSIGDYAFYGSKTLARTSSIVIPNNIKQIGTYSFANSNISSVTLHNTITNIGLNAFENCIFSEIKMEENTMLVEENNTSEDDIFVFYKVDNGVLLEAEKASNNDRVFSTRIIAVESSITELSVDSSIRRIDRNVFINNSNLTSLVFLNRDLSSVENMSDYPWGIEPSKLSNIISFN